MIAKYIRGKVIDSMIVIIDTCEHKINMLLYRLYYYIPSSNLLFCGYEVIMCNVQWNPA